MMIKGGHQLTHFASRATRRALQDAHTKSHRITRELLFLQLIQTPDGQEMMARLSIDLDQVKQALVITYQPANIDEDGLPFSEGAKASFSYASRLANAKGKGSINSMDILRGIIVTEDSQVGKILQEMGLDLAELDQF